MIEIALDIMNAVLLIVISVEIGIEVGRYIERHNFYKIMMSFFECYENELDKSGKDEFSNGVFFISRFLFEAYKLGREES